MTLYYLLKKELNSHKHLMDKLLSKTMEQITEQDKKELIKLEKIIRSLELQLKNIL